MSSCTVCDELPHTISFFPIWIETDMEGVERGSASAFVFHSCPHCSLTRAQERLVFGSLVVLCFGVAIGFASMGFWLILPFAGLEIGLLAWALEALRNREGDYETLTIDGDEVMLEWRAGKQAGSRTMNRQWVQVACKCSAPGINCRLSVKSHGRETEVGHHLSDEARLQLAATLRSKLQA
jgi:uncharacterized membrane protein